MKLALFALSLITLPVMAAATTVSAAGLVSLLVWIIVIGMIFGLLWWLIGYVGLPQPFDKVARVILAVVAVLLLINLLLGLMGSPLVNFR